MKTNFRSIAFCVIISLSIYAGKANAGIKIPITDSVCCNPDSLKVVSVNYPVFCVSWKVSTDSTCKHPYGFTVQWRPYPGSGAWTERIKIYTGGTTINFCDSVDTCRNYQWRVRTICDTTNGGIYSDWVYGNKFAMNCIGGKAKISVGFINVSNNTTNKVNLSAPMRKPEEEKK